jgi:Flp pilus assembly protein TadB
MRGAPITVRCDCGEVEHVAYGDSWSCPNCERRWNTTQIPEAEYWGIMQEMRRYRLQVIIASVVVALVFAVVFITVGRRFLPMALLVMGLWFLVYMPYWRKKVRRRARELPRWLLEPE